MATASLSIKEGVAFIPEIKNCAKIKKEICPNLFLLPISNKHVKHLKKVIKDKGYEIKDGTFLYFKGPIKEDGTLYEVFQSYSLALTFYYEGLATCRAYQEICDGEYKDIELFITENDNFGYDEEDKRTLKLIDIKFIREFYKRIYNELSSKGFNPLMNSLEFFNKFLREREIKPRLLYLNICLESIFLSGNDSEGISYKLGVRCANLLYQDDNKIDKYDTYTEVKNGYDLRSKIIHGGNYDKESQAIINKKKTKSNITRTELDHVLILEKIVKRVYKIVLGDNDLCVSVSNGELGGKIDSIILSV